MSYNKYILSSRNLQYNVGDHQMQPRSMNTFFACKSYIHDGKTQQSYEETRKLSVLTYVGAEKLSGCGCAQTRCGHVGITLARASFTL